MRQIASVSSGVSRAGRQSREIVAVGRERRRSVGEEPGALETRGEFSVNGELTV